MMECYTQEYPTAKKEHECEFCNRIIPKGEKYSCEKGKWEGDFFTRKLCLPCRNMLDAYLTDTGYDEFNWEDVGEFLGEEHCRNCAYREDCNKIPQRCEHVTEFYKEEL